MDRPVPTGLLEEWELTETGQTWHGRCATVRSVTTADGTPAVLKIGLPHPEAAHEHIALQHWHGRGAVRLLRADPGRWALLLERAGPRDLTEEWDLAACETVAGLYADLHRPALPQLRPLSADVTGWVSDLAALPRSAPLPRRLVEQAIAIGRDLAADADTDSRVVHGDLHYANVLAADRAPWLAIDPKPVNGDPHHEIAPLLWNRFDELAGDVRDGLRRRFHTVVDAAGLDEDRARDWEILRVVVNAMRGIEDDEPPPAEDATTCVTIAKAVQD